MNELFVMMILVFIEEKSFKFYPCELLRITKFFASPWGWTITLKKSVIEGFHLFNYEVIFTT